jgi:PhzF family phenazine biosynthesis protein
VSPRITQVDAFTNTAFAGNPAAVCILAAPREDAWMQSVAREMNLSETAFLLKRKDGFDLRWFTPTIEVDLCGHATLASAHVLWQDGYLEAGEAARFHTRSGLLTAVRAKDWIELDFPATPAEATDAPPGLMEALGVTPRWLGRSPFDYLLEISDEATLRALTPDFGALRRIQMRGVIVTALSESTQCDFVSRFFAPAAGIDEDPVTGSAHAALVPYWSNRLGRDQFVAHQVSARGGVVRGAVRGDRVVLGGQAVTVLSGELLS